MTPMCYTNSVETVGSGTFFVPRRNCISQSSLEGKLPSMSGLTSRLPSRQRMAAHGGHFAVTIFTLYQYTNRATGQRYIGVTDNPIRRARLHAQGKSGARAFNSAVKALGIEAFAYKVLAFFDDVSAAAYHEQAAIETFGTLSPEGYNLFAGAPYTRYAGPPSAETRELRSAALMGNQNSLGYKHTAEARERIGAATRGKPGRIPSDADRARMSAAAKGRSSWNKGKQLSAGHRASLSAARTGKPWSAARRAAHDAKKRAAKSQP